MTLLEVSNLARTYDVRRSRWPFWAFLGLSWLLEPLGQPAGRLALADSKEEDGRPSRGWVLPAFKAPWTAAR